MKKSGEKGVEKRRPLIEVPSVLILHEKHDAPMFFIQDEESLWKAALAVLRARDDSGYYYFEPEDPGEIDIVEEDVGKLPASFQNDARKKLENHACAVHWFKEAVAWHDRKKKALSERDGREAWRLLSDRRDCEYERLEIRKFLDPKEYRA